MREKDEQGAEYEDWIYGEPPKDVDFVRIVGDEVVRVETMKVGGQKIVKTEKEIDLGGPQVAAAAQKGAKPDEGAHAPASSEEASQPSGVDCSDAITEYHWQSIASSVSTTPPRGDWRSDSVP
jgi:hypothetical protein